MLLARHVSRGGFQASALLLLVLLSAPPPGLVAQTRHLSDTTQVITAAAEYAYSRLEATTSGLPERVVALDRSELVVGPAGLPRQGGEHEGALLAAASRALGARIIDTRVAIRCEDTPRDCTLRGATVVVRVGVPQLSNGVARVQVELIYTVAPAPRWILRTAWNVVLRFDGQEWRAVDAELLWTT